MASHDIDTVLGWRGSTVVDRDGEKIGTFEELYLDQADRPAWAAVKTGLFGMKQTFVPLSEAEPVEQGLQVPFDKEQVKDAPNVDPDTHLSDEEEERLYRHYGLDSAGTAPDTREDVAREREAVRSGPPAAERGDEQAAVAGGPRADADVDAATREDAARAGTSEATADAREAPADGDAPVEMTRSEEELVVGTRKVERGRARLKKYVVTEHVQRTIPVQREEVRVEYDPPEAGEATERRDEA
jgi:stress response protein YsnF